MPATSPADRKRLAARAITRHRSRDDGVEFAARGSDRTVRLSYADRAITLDLTEAADPVAARRALDDLLTSFPVFKFKQPATRKAQDGTVHVSALADPKHAADFLEACCRDVFDLGESYALETEDEAADDDEELIGDSEE
ncbi:MAG: hypothetical protein ABEJ05_09460 [Haloglomus sp.]